MSNLENRARAAPRGEVVFFCFHILGVGARKGGVVFWAEEFAARGWRTKFVTTQLSTLTRLARSPRITRVPRAAINAWRDIAPNLSTYTWVAPIHPVAMGSAALNWLTKPLCALYAMLLPKTLRDAVQSADVVVLDSTVAVTLFRLVKRLNPRATVIYASSDPLDVVGMHPHLKTILMEDVRRYDLVAILSEILRADFPKDAKIELIPQGLDKRLFDTPTPSPYENQGPNAVIAGDMMFDAASVARMVDHFPSVTFNVFGNSKLGDLADRSNVIDHGEKPFDELRRYIIHGDIGLAPYQDRPELHYLVESSLKLQQYTYARLPIVAPYFCAGGRNNICAYQPNAPETAVPAMKAALAFNRDTIDRSQIRDWPEVVDHIIRAAGIAERGGGAVSSQERAPQVI